MYKIHLVLYDSNNDIIKTKALVKAKRYKDIMEYFKCICHTGWLKNIIEHSKIEMKP